MMATGIISEVQKFWENDPCGTYAGTTTKDRRVYFQEIEDYRYQQEPYIHAFAQFSRFHGKKVLEVGMGAGTDFLQWCRVGADAYGVDLTEQSIKLVRERLELEGLHAHVQTMNAETLPFESETFDLVYSFGVIHHSEHPQKIIDEVYRILKPGAHAKMMLYNRYSWHALQYYLLFGLLKGKPLRSLDDIMWHHRESVATKVYSRRQLKKLFQKFSSVDLRSKLTTSDYVKEPVYYERMKQKGTASKLFVMLYPGWLIKLFGDRFGFYHLIDVIK